MADLFISNIKINDTDYKLRVKNNFIINYNKSTSTIDKTADQIKELAANYNHFNYFVKLYVRTETVSAYMNTDDDYYTLTSFKIKYVRHKLSDPNCAYLTFAHYASEDTQSTNKYIDEIYLEVDFNLKTISIHNYNLKALGTFTSASEFSSNSYAMYLGETTDTLTYGCVYYKDSSEIITRINTVPIVDNVISSDSTSALSAKQGKLLNDRINNIQNIGRFLSILDVEHGTVASQPVGSIGDTYDYHVGDYYRVSGIGNYVPKSSSIFTIDGSSGSTNFVWGEVQYSTGAVIYCSNITGSTATWTAQASSGSGTVVDVRVNNESVVASTGIANITVDSALSSTSTNALQNKVVNASLNNKVDKITGKGLSSCDYTQAEKTKLAGIDSNAQVNVLEGVLLNTAELTIADKKVTIPVINNTETADANKPLSANMGKELQDQITNLKARGRFLSLWDCGTGMAVSEPTVDEYEYKTGDYFIVSQVLQNTPYYTHYTNIDNTSSIASTAEFAISYVFNDVSGSSFNTYELLLSTLTTEIVNASGLITIYSPVSSEDYSVTGISKSSNNTLLIWYVSDPSYGTLSSYELSSSDVTIIEYNPVKIYNKKPAGTAYIKASPLYAEETAEVTVGDTYYFDGSQWILQINTQKEVTFANITGQPTDNANLASALNDKVDKIEGKQLSTNDFTDLEKEKLDALATKRNILHFTCASMTEFYTTKNLKMEESDYSALKALIKTGSYDSDILLRIWDTSNSRVAFVYPLDVRLGWQDNTPRETDNFNRLFLRLYNFETESMRLLDVQCDSKTVGWNNF